MTINDRIDDALQVSETGSQVAAPLPDLFSPGFSSKPATQHQQKLPSLVEIKRRLPEHCFQPSLPRSLLYVAKDFALIAALYLLLKLFEARVYEPHVAAHPYLVGGSYALVVAAYWLLQGTMFWAVFVLGHDCGHGSFSRYPLINDFAGLLLHSFILVPYHSWKFSHRKHHKNTGNYQKDEIFMPVTEDNTVSTVLLNNYFLLGLSWFVYLLYGYPQAQGRPGHSHYNPFAELHRSKELQIVITIAGDLGMLYLLYRYAGAWGWASLAVDYLVPLAVFASWLVVVTFLHHHADSVAWYPDAEWDYVKGNLSSVDRNYGWAHALTHHIGTHQIHHLFPAIPHYHLVEATQHFRREFPDLIVRSDEGIVEAFVHNCRAFATQFLPGNDALPSVFCYNYDISSPAVAGAASKKDQ